MASFCFKADGLDLPLCPDAPAFPSLNATLHVGVEGRQRPLLSGGDPQTQQVTLAVHLGMVFEAGAEMQAGVVGEQLHIAGLQDVVDPNLGRCGELVEELDGLQLQLGEARDLGVALRQEVIGVAEVDAQVALEGEGGTGGVGWNG